MEMGSLSAQGLDGPFELSTQQKDITLQDFAHSVKISNTNGDIQLSTQAPPKLPIEVQSQKGEIELQLPESSSFQIDATSRHGEVDCDFSGPGLKVQSEGEAPSISGSYGKGGPIIRLSTSYGTIRLARLGLRPPKTPAPPRAPEGEAPGTGKRITLRRQQYQCPLTRVAAYARSSTLHKN
jgi:hypothetical protein